jgi:hypothetical protein
MSSTLWTQTTWIETLTDREDPAAQRQQFAHPLHVVHDDVLDVDAKRHILEMWKTDAQRSDESIVSPDEVRFALNKLEQMYCSVS